MFIFFFFKQSTAYEMRISDWSSDVCSSDLLEANCQVEDGCDAIVDDVVIDIARRNLTADGGIQRAMTEFDIGEHAERRLALRADGAPVAPAKMTPADRKSVV